MVSYYISLGEKFYYVPRFYVGAGFGKNKSEINDTDVTEQNTSMFQVGLNLLNFEFRPSDHIGIMFNAGDLGYRTDITKEGDNKPLEPQLLARSEPRRHDRIQLLLLILPAVKARSTPPFSWETAVFRIN